MWYSQWIKSRAFRFGLCGLALQQEMAAFEQRHRDPELHDGRKLTDLWHFTIIFSDERGSRQGFTLQWQTLSPLLWQDTHQWSCGDRGLLFCSGLMMSHHQGEKAQQQERHTKMEKKKKKHMWHIKWERRGRKRQLRFSYGKCFPYKSSFLTPPPRLLLECSIFRKWLLFRVSSLSVQKWEMGWQT